MKIWIDPKQPAPIGYIWCKSIDEVKERIQECESSFANLYRQGIMKPDLLVEHIDVSLTDCELSELVRWNTVTKREYPIVYHESTHRMRYHIGMVNHSGITCDTWDEFIMYLQNEKDKIERRGSDVFEIEIIDNHSSIIADIAKINVINDLPQYCEGISGTGDPNAVIYG